MGKFYETIDQDLIDKRDSFLKQIESDMHYTMNRKSLTLSFDWLDEIEKADEEVYNVFLQLMVYPADRMLLAVPVILI